MKINYHVILFVQDRKTAPSFTDLTELVAVIKTPNIPASVLEKRARLFEYRSSGDEDSDQDVDQVDFLPRKRGGSLTEQDISLNDQDYLSGMEEGGYEVCFIVVVIVVFVVGSIMIMCL